MIVGDGRPFRFLAMIGGGWVAVRVGLVWYATGSFPHAVREILPIPRSAVAASIAPPRAAAAQVAAAIRTPASAIAVLPGTGVAPTNPANPARIQLALLAMTRFGEALPGAVTDTGAANAGNTPPRHRDATAALLRAAPPSRLSVSSWMIARGGTGIGATPLSPQLGGTQGGIRVDYALTRGIAATARVAAPAAGAGRELSLGIAWRPAGVPLRFVAEHRLALDGGRSGPALGVSGGVSELRLPAGFRLDGYGQAGAILRNGVEKYLDASVRAARPVTDIGRITLDLGGGAWGGAQRGVARLDVGPSVGARVPLAGQSMRVSLDWRQRIAGDARPGSGPALSLGTDF